MLRQSLIWGSIIGIIHFVMVGILYGNPLIDKIYKNAQKKFPGVKKWNSQTRYLLTQFLGTQIEIYILTFSFFLFRPLIGQSGVIGAIQLGAIFSAIRVYPRFWNMWIQSTYPTILLKIEFFNGVISTLIVTVGLQLLIG